MSIKVFVQKPLQLEKITDKPFDFETIESLQNQLKNKQYAETDVPFFNVSFSNTNNLKLAFVSFEEKYITGLLSTEWCESPYHSLTKSHWLIQNIGVSDKFQGQGLSSLLISKMFDTFNDLGLAGIYQSSYSNDGWERTMHKFSSESKKYPSVRFIDGKRRFE